MPNTAHLLSNRSDMASRWTAAALATIVSFLAGLSLAVDPRALVVLPFAGLFAIPAVRAGQIVLGLVLLQGATAPFGEVVGLNPIYLAAWIVASFLYLSDGMSNRVLRPSIAIALTAYVSCLFASGLLHGGAAGFATALPLVNYVGVFLLTAMLARKDVQLLFVPLVSALIVHEVVAASELIRNATWFYADWKLLEATKVAGITRVASTVADPNYFGVTLVILVSACLTLGRRSGHLGTAKALALGAALILPFTFSRAAALAVIVALLVAALRTGLAVSSRLALRGGIAAAVVIATIAVLAPSAPSALLDRYSPTQQADASIRTRSTIQELGLELAFAHPVTGLGPGGFESRAKALYDPTKPQNLQTDVLNTYLQAAISGGVLAFLAFVALYAFSAWPLVSMATPLGYGLIGGTVALLTLNGLTFAPLWFALGLGSILGIQRSGAASAPESQAR